MATDNQNVVSMVLNGTTTYYASLQEAIDAIDSSQSNIRINLLQNVEGTLDFSKLDNNGRNFNVNINLGRYTFTTTDTIKVGSEAYIVIQKGNITSTNNFSTLIANNGGEIRISRLETMNTNILLSGSSSVTEYQFILENATVNGDLFLDSEAIAASILNNLLIENGTFTKNSVITEDNVGKFIASATESGNCRVISIDSIEKNKISNANDNVTINGTAGNDHFRYN